MEDYSPKGNYKNNMKLNDVPDKVLADMVRNGCYAKDAEINGAKDGTQWLLVLAVPYGKRDSCDSLQEAFEGFRELLSAEDWDERNLQVLQMSKKGTPKVYEVAYENLGEGDWR